MQGIIRIARVSVLFAVLIVFCSSPGIFASSDEFIKGSWTITYLIRDPQKVLIVPTVTSAGFNQRILPIHRGYQVTVTAVMDPLDYQDAFKDHSQPGPEDPPVPEALSKMLVGITSCSGTVRAVLDFLEDQAFYSNVEQDQTWQEVLRRGNGNCEGRVNLAVELLSRLDITSRSVLGCVFENGKAVFHRWLEVDYPGLGALPCDPGRSQDFVDPMHLILYPAASAGIEPRDLLEMGVEIDILSETRNVSLFDLRRSSSDPDKRVMRRKLHPARYSAAISGRITPPQGVPQLIQLSMNGKTVETQTDAFGNFSFTGLESGEYSIAYRPADTSPVTRYGTLGDKQLEEITIVTGQTSR